MGVICPSSLHFKQRFPSQTAKSVSELLVSAVADFGKIEEQRVIIYGAGSAGLGIARQLRDAMRLSSLSLSEEDAGQRFWLIDKNGLIKTSIGDRIRDGIEQSFIRREDHWGNGETGLLEVVKRVKPTVMIGTSTHAGAFSEEVVKEMSKHVDRPIIFPVSEVCASPFIPDCGQLSNPTRLCEMEWVLHRCTHDR